MTAIPKSPRSEELLTQLLVLPTDLSAIESLLREKNYTSDEISRAGYDYAESCRYEVLDYTALISALIHLCDREPERTEEAMARVEAFIRHFARIYGVKER